MKFYFVRHGESEANVLREFSNSGVKHPLTKKGVEQARTLAYELRDKPFAMIYSSPVLRAMQTAHILADPTNAPVEVTEALREWSVGIYEGTTGPERWELHRQVQEEWYFHGKPESKMPEGENLLEVQNRFIPFIEALVEEHRDSDQNILCVAHGGLYLAMLPILFKNVKYASVVEQGIPHTTPAVADVRTDGLYCTSWFGSPIDA